MKLRVVTCVLALAALLSLGCNQSALLSLQEENARLKEQVKRLQAELATPQAAPPQTKTNSTPAKAAPNETVNVPAALLAEAKSYADRKMWPNAVPALKSLLAIYPDAAEVPEAKRLLKEAETENKEIGDSTDQKQEQQEKKRPGQVVNPVKYLERKIDEVEGIT
ncbi:MAG: hypothetical protein KQJ78_10550, partial [Deltaproteobacteria bacterium]|nr:hypothetical protein [Deltaproteobacteria bacterium]